MRVPIPVVTVTPSSRLQLACIGGLLLGGLSIVGTGCTPDSTGSPASTDTTTVAAQNASSTSEAAPGTSSTSLPPEADEPRTVAQRLDDASVAARVKQALARTRSLRPFDFTPTAVRGRLTLRGNVETRKQYQQAGRVAANVEGVTTVQNEVTVEGRPISAVEESSSSGDETEYHTVRRGDTLSEIAHAYGVPVQRLRSLNDLSGTLRPGQRIRVR